MELAGVPLHLYFDLMKNRFLAWINRSSPPEALKNRLWSAWARGNIHQFAESHRSR